MSDTSSALILKLWFWNSNHDSFIHIPLRESTTASVLFVTRHLEARQQFLVRLDESEHLFSLVRKKTLVEISLNFSWVKDLTIKLIHQGTEQCACNILAPMSSSDYTPDDLIGKQVLWHWAWLKWKAPYQNCPFFTMLWNHFKVKTHKMLFTVLIPRMQLTFLRLSAKTMNSRKSSYVCLRKQWTHASLLTFVCENNELTQAPPVW